MVLIGGDWTVIRAQWHQRQLCMFVTMLAVLRWRLYVCVNLHRPCAALDIDNRHTRQKLIEMNIYTWGCSFSRLRNETVETRVQEPSKWMTSNSARDDNDATAAWHTAAAQACAAVCARVSSRPISFIRRLKRENMWKLSLKALKCGWQEICESASETLHSC